VTPEQERAAKFGMLGAAFGLGFVVGPAIGGLLGGISLRLPFYAAAGLSLANALYGFFILPESLPKAMRAPFAWSKANPIGSLDLLRSHPRLLGLALISFFGHVAHDSLPSVFVLYADYRYHWGEREVGLCLAGVGVATTIVAALLVGPLVRRLGERRALLTGLTFGAAGFGVYGWAPTGSWFLAGIPLIAVWGLAGPAFQALMSRRVSPNEQGRLQGALASMAGITGMIGPLLFTQIFAFGISSKTLHLPGAAFWTSSLLLCVSVLVAWLVAHDSPPASS
jgi:DHA1 family tetracycline resistance protein-like MFS transporter